MSTDEQVPTNTTAPVASSDDHAMDEGAGDGTVPMPTEAQRSEKILKAKELYNQGSRNFLVKSYIDAADELSQVCALYEELYGELSDELGMPYLLYAKSLIALALDENKVIDVPDEEEDDDDDDDDDVDDDEENEGGGEEAVADAAAKDGDKKKVEKESTNGATAAKLCTIDEVEKVEKSEADSAAAVDTTPIADAVPVADGEEKSAEAQVTSSSANIDAKGDSGEKNEEKNGTASTEKTKNGSVVIAQDDEKPSTSNGEGRGENGIAEEVEEENEAASNLQLAWEILELAAKIFSRQGLGGLSNLAEVQTELGNIEFENSVLDAAREDYEKALSIYKDLPTNYRRAMAEIHYKIGLTYLMQQLNKEGAASLKEACALIEGEIEEIKAKGEDLTEKDKNNIQDMEETKQEIWAKISEIEETEAQNVAEVRAALDSYIKPITSQNAAGASSSSSAAAAASSSSAAASSSSAASSSVEKPKDISHLIKRKKPDEAGSTDAVSASPAKRPVV